MSEPHDEAVVNAAHALISVVLEAERKKRARMAQAELTLEVELTGGGVETWTITIARTASSH